MNCPYHRFHTLIQQRLPSVSINRSTVAELIQIPQISPEFATEIINQREQSGNFTDLINLQQRLGLSG